MKLGRCTCLCHRDEDEEPGQAVVRIRTENTSKDLCKECLLIFCIGFLEKAEEGIMKTIRQALSNAIFN